MFKQAFKYFPFQPQLDNIPNIMTDSGRTSATVLELSHWPGNKTPFEFKADTSTEIAMKFIASDDFYHYLSFIDWVSSDHYDIDGLLSVWVMTEGNKALEKFDILRDIATVGDFDRYVSDDSLKSCLILYYFEQEILQRAIEKSNWKTNDVTRFLYSSMFPLIYDSIERHEQYRHFWEDKYKQIQKERNTINSGNAVIRNHPEFDLAIVISDTELSDFVVNEHVSALKVLCIWDQYYVLRYRYESFVEMTSMVTAPRFELDGLISQLNALEKNKGTWFCENIVTAHPKLQLYNNQQVPSRSSINESVFVETVLNYFNAVSKDETRQWHPVKGWTSSGIIPLPPSIREHGV